MTNYRETCRIRFLKFMCLVTDEHEAKAQTLGIFQLKPN